MGAEIYDGTLATEIGHDSGVLETEDGFHIMLRLPIDYDAVPLTYSEIDGADAGQYTFCSLAARTMYEKYLVQLAEMVSVKQTDTLDTLDFNELFCAQ